MKIEGNTVLSGKGDPNSATYTTVLGADRIYVGEKTGNKVVKTDPETGLNYLADEIVAKEVYNVETQKHGPWIMVALETGRRGWFPGSKALAKLRLDADVWETENDSLETGHYIGLADVNYEVEILTVLDKNNAGRQFDPAEDVWYEIHQKDASASIDIKGYIRAGFIERSSLKYVARQ